MFWFMKIVNLLKDQLGNHLFYLTGMKVTLIFTFIFIFGMAFCDEIDGDDGDNGNDTDTDIDEPDSDQMEGIDDPFHGRKHCKLNLQCLVSTKRSHILRQTYR